MYGGPPEYFPPGIPAWLDINRRQPSTQVCLCIGERVFCLCTQPRQSTRRLDRREVLLPCYRRWRWHRTGAGNELKGMLGSLVDLEASLPIQIVHWCIPCPYRSQQPASILNVCNQHDEPSMKTKLPLRGANGVLKLL